MLPSRLVGAAEEGLRLLVIRLEALLDKRRRSLPFDFEAVVT